MQRSDMSVDGPQLPIGKSAHATLSGSKRTSFTRAENGAIDPERNSAVIRVTTPLYGYLEVRGSSLSLVYRPASADDLIRAEALVVASINDLTERHGFGPMAWETN